MEAVGFLSHPPSPPFFKKNIHFTDNQKYVV